MLLLHLFFHCSPLHNYLSRSTSSSSSPATTSALAATIASVKKYLTTTSLFVSSRHQHQQLQRHQAIMIKQRAAQHLPFPQWPPPPHQQLMMLHHPMNNNNTSKHPHFRLLSVELYEPSLIEVLAGSGGQS